MKTTKYLRIIPIILLLLICNLKVLATAQVPDLMVIGKDTFLMHTNPLEIYLDSIGNRDLPDFKADGSTACWRGYQALWKLEDDSLFLTKIQSCHRNEGDDLANLEKMFGDKFINGKVYAYWFTGLIVLPYGRLISYVHMGYGSTFSRYLLLEISKGQFQKALKLNNRQYERFKDKQFELFKKTPEYKNIVEDLKAKGYRDEKFFDSFLRSYIIKYTSIILNE